MGKRAAQSNGDAKKARHSVPAVTPVPPGTLDREFLALFGDDPDAPSSEAAPRDGSHSDATSDDAAPCEGSHPDAASSAEAALQTQRQLPEDPAAGFQAVAVEPALPAGEDIATPSDQHRPELLETPQKVSTKMGRHGEAAQRIPDTSAISVCGSLRHDVVNENKPTCVKCQLPCNPLRSYLKSKTAVAEAMRWVCGGCNRVTTCMSRNMRWPPPGFQALSSKQQVEFFRDACKQGEDARLNYTKIKGLLVSTLVESECERLSASSGGTYMPLSWYKQKGADESQLKAIEEKADYEWHSVLGHTYKVDLKTVEKAVIMTRVSETLAKAERVVRTKKPNGSEADDLSNMQGDDDVELVSMTATPAPPPAELSDKERKKQEKKEAAAKAAAEKKQRAEQAAAEKKAESDRQKHNLKVVQLAAKCSMILQPLVDSMRKLLASKHDGMSPTVAADLSSSLSEAKSALDAATEVQKQQTKANKMKTLLPAMPLTVDDLKALNKTCNENISSFSQIQKVLTG